MERRLFEHQNGLIEKSFTHKRRPIELIFLQIFANKIEAIQAEKQIKKWSRKKKEALINGDFSLLKKLSECQNNSHCQNKPKC